MEVAKVSLSSLKKDIIFPTQVIIFSLSIAKGRIYHFWARKAWAWKYWIIMCVILMPLCQTDKKEMEYRV